MIQTKIFIGTVAEVEAQANAYLAALVRGAQVTVSPLIVVPGDGELRVIKELIVNLPEYVPSGPNGKPADIVVPKPGGY